MDIAGFFISPLGWVFAAVLLTVAVVSFRATSLAIRQRNVVYHALLAGAKDRALRKVSVIIPLRRRADSLAPLFEQLSAQHYGKLEVLVVVYQTAGKAAPNAARTLARRSGLTVKTIKHTKGMTLETAASKRATGDIAMLADADYRFSNRFFEKVSLAFTQPIDATRIRHLTSVDRSLRSAYWAIITAFQQLLFATLQRPVQVTGLNYGIIVRRQLLKKNAPFLAGAELYDEYAVASPYQAQVPSWRSVVTLIATAAIVGLVILTTASDLLLYVTSLITAVLYLVTTITLMQQTGLTRSEKAHLFFIVPFMPIFISISLLFRTLYVAYSAIARLLQRLLGRKKRLTPRARTQAERLSI